MAIPIITIPTENDILCGRGKGYDGCRANQIFRSTIADNAARYSGFQKNRTQKSILIHLIAHQLKMNNMRFVKRTNHGWKTLQEKEVNLKVRTNTVHRCFYSLQHAVSLRLSDWARTKRCWSPATKITEESLHKRFARKTKSWNSTREEAHQSCLCRKQFD